ncbi:hypothetical protein Y1Q_0017238 [Alligator mississippiensis]|uniref:DDE Tnp4 domain-containing protein n=1 Tax=Alligator mississippiensis TaxID=8496 RepID=A0A151NL83_ALLMI|nr:hypothetical protein Y1Q_0017238 [Alligator mississippiensis]
MWQPFPADTQVAIALFNLAMPTSLHYVSHLFGVGKATAREAILEVCGTLQDMVRHTVLCMHNPLAVVAGFHALGFPQCIGALDGSHIPTTCPPHGDHSHYSWRGFHSIMPQAIVDHCGAFTNISAGWIGSTNNTLIFCNSTLPALVGSGCFALAGVGPPARSQFIKYTQYITKQK